MKRWCAPLVLVAALWTGRAAAVEPAAIKVVDKWSVVGVISGDSAGIVVLRNNQSKRTYTLAVGDALPTEFGYTLRSVKGKSVIVASESEAVTLGFAESSVPDEPERDSRTARFIDNYYRGFSDSPMEVFTSPEDVDPERPVDAQSLRLPLQRFGTLKDEAARTRFELYRSEADTRDQPAYESEADAPDFELE
jgi:hypothetical protein